MPGLNLRKVQRASALHNHCVNIPHPPIADVDWVLDAEDISAIADNIETVFDATATGWNEGFLPQTGRNVTVTVTDAAAADLTATVIVEGKNQFDESISETFSGLTGAGGTSVGSKIFKEVTKIRFTGANMAASDLLDVGFGDRLGLPFLPHDETRVSISRVVVDTAAAGPAGATTFAGSTSLVDKNNGALVACGSGGSGAIVDDDVITAYYVSKPTTAEDNGLAKKVVG